MTLPDAILALSPIAPIPYRPFIDPIDVNSYWFLLLIPLALGVALAYKAVRVPDLKNLPKQVLLLSVQIILGMIALGAAFYLFVNWIVPLVVPRS